MEKKMIWSSEMLYDDEARENYLENMPALHFEGGCGIDPTRQHGSKTYKKYFDRGYDYDTNTPTVLYRLYCYWCDGFMYIVEYPDP